MPGRKKEGGDMINETKVQYHTVIILVKYGDSVNK